MYEWSVDKSILGLVKTMKSNHIKDTMEEGRFFFNFPEYYKNTDLMPAQNDRYDSWESVNARHLVFAPIIRETEHGPVYGKAQPLADHAIINTISTENKHRPICCFRTVKKEDFVEHNDAYYYSLGETAARIKKDFGHDAYIYIFNPLELHKRLNKLSLLYGHEVFYGMNSADYYNFVDKIGLEQCRMFQKSQDYAWQKEYRIVLPPREDNSAGFPIDIGSIEDIAICGNIEDLFSGGIVFGDADNPIFNNNSEVTAP